MNCYIKLLDILGFAHRTLYTLKRSKKRGAEAEQWNHQVVAELDSAMNHWIDSLPEHLKWDPHTDSVFSKQSASLYASYYHVQIQIHRPFIPSPGRSSPLSYPSLAVCANSARACSHVMKVQSRREGLLPLAHIKMALFDSSVILLLIVWSGRRNGLNLDTSTEIRDVHSNLGILKSFEHRWQIAGRLWDTIYAMLSAGDLLDPKGPPAPPSLKRDRDSDAASTRRSGSHDAYSSPGAASTSGSDFSSAHPGSIEGSRLSSPLESDIRGVPLQDHRLPVHSADLGRHPVQHFEITNPFVQNTHLSADDLTFDGMDGWSTSFQPQPGHDPLSQKTLPSDFFSSVLDNSLGAAEGENPGWTYAPATDANWSNWDQFMQTSMPGGIQDTSHLQ
ncbi:Zn(2)-C6 fungal-type domain-containing protein [Mycena sanguinolenta]|uniref:Zn(2)-C6 fungal-type domain-containing protein n=1 Tax=Mycena sanguinolenta TaxID=230812 RepID=A0A8H6ZC41_9AGAR|nr:Zn(2)-C6 fungal-type domain-containing protein [Mycena sanguinolenta]